MSAGRSQLYFIYDIFKISFFSEGLVFFSDINIPFGYGIGIGVLIQIGYYFVGYIWDLFGGYHAMAEFTNKRNPTLLKIKEALGIEPDDNK